MAVPVFLLLILVELVVDRIRQTGHYRSNDAINSLSAGALSTTTGYFTKFLEWTIWGFVLSNFALVDMQRSWFDSSWSGIGLWVLAALGWDLCYYWQHRLGHEVSILWAAHAVHHQSEDYNLSTALRQTSSGFIFGWIFYLPLFLLGFPIDVLITVGAINLIYQFWVHTQQVRRLGVLDRILVTPSNHRVHHAQNECYIDKNYGGIFVIWDRIFGSFAEERDEVPVVFGVRKPLQNWNPIWANFQVYNYLWFDARNTARWQDKIGVWFRRTGWRPADMEAQHPRTPGDLDHFQKFDPKVSRARHGYVMVQFALLAVATMWVGEVYAKLGAQAVLVPCLLLWASLYALGLLNEDRKHARLFERVRLLIIVPLAFAAFDASVLTMSLTVWLCLGSYILVSFLCLKK